MLIVIPHLCKSQPLSGYNVKLENDILYEVHTVDHKDCEDPIVQCLYKSIIDYVVAKKKVEMQYNRDISRLKRYDDLIKEFIKE